MGKFAFYIFYGINWVITLLPLPVLYLSSDFFYFILNYIIKYRRKVIEENLRNAFPEKSQEEITKIRKKYTRHLCDVFIETLKVQHIGRNEINRRVKYNNPEIVDQLTDEGKSIIVVTGHLGNWEWYFGAPMHTKAQPLAAFKPLSNKEFEKMLNNFRGKFGCLPVTMNLIFRTILDFKR